MAASSILNDQLHGDMDISEPTGTSAANTSNATAFRSNHDRTSPVQHTHALSEDENESPDELSDRGSHVSSEDENAEEVGEEREDEHLCNNRDIRPESVEVDDTHSVSEGVVSMDDDAEGVGAVKIKPGETDDEDNEANNSENDLDAPSVTSASSDENEDEGGMSDGEASWEEHVVTDDAASEDTPDNNCMFCGDDEEHDPGDEFEIWLVCSQCGGNSHQQCARRKSAFHAEEVTSAWACPGCRARSELNVNSRHSSPRIEARNLSHGHDTTGTYLAKDLLSSPRGVRPDSHSVFDQLVHNDDPLNGSRLLRKRKSSHGTTNSEDKSKPRVLRKRIKHSSNDLISQSQSESPAADHFPEARHVSSHAPSVIIERSRNSLIATFKLSTEDLRRYLGAAYKAIENDGITAIELKRTRRTVNTRPLRIGRPHIVAPLAPAGLVAPFASSSQPFYSFFDKDTDETNAKAYGGILSELEADTSKTLPTDDDRRRFDEARRKAEEVWLARELAMQVEVELPIRKSKKSSNLGSQIETIVFGDWEIDTWYEAPYPEEYSRNRFLYICEFCLKYMNSPYVAWRHQLKCSAKHPPGDEIYRRGKLSFFEVDGRKNPVYCRNLCLLAKLFLGSKTLYYDVEPFLFYVLCEYDIKGYHLVGYFSKEKRSASLNNVSCILTLPCHQRKGYGHLLIDFSYLLTRVEGKTGSPEKPLSDMGLVSYRSYWRLVLCRWFLENWPRGCKEDLLKAVSDIANDTGLTPDDVVSALEGLRTMVKDPVTGLHAYRVDHDYYEDYVLAWEAKRYERLEPAALVWTPFITGRTNIANFELGPALSTMASRDEDITAAGNCLEACVSHAHLAIAEPVVIPSTETEHHTDLDETTAITDGMGHTPPIYRDSAALLDRGGESDGGKIQQGLAAAVYDSIPPTRFQIVPTMGPRRVDRPRVTMPPPLMTGGSPRPRQTPARNKSSGRKRTPAASCAATNRRKSGGTGRGPGRWPKGTKKSDYGNADSGPGLPPAWIRERQEKEQRETQENVEETQWTAKGIATEPNQPKNVDGSTIETGHCTIDFHKITDTDTDANIEGRCVDGDSDAHMGEPL